MRPFAPRTRPNLGLTAGLPQRSDLALGCWFRCQSVEAACNLGVEAGHEVSVGVEGRLDRGVTETGLDHLGVLTLLDQKSGVCVPEVVKPKRPEVVTAALAFRRLRLEFRPLVLVYAQLREEGSDLVELLIANVGREPASDVRISWSQRLPNLIPRGGQDINDLPLWSHIPVLVPGSPLRLDLGRGADLLKESIMRYEATVEYSQAGGRGRSFSDPAVIDIEVFKGTSIAKRGPRSGTS